MAPRPHCPNASMNQQCKVDLVKTNDVRENLCKVVAHRSTLVRRRTATRTYVKAAEIAWVGLLGWGKLPT